MIIAQVQLNVAYFISAIETVDTLEEADSMTQHVTCSRCGRNELLAEATRKIATMKVRQMTRKRFHNKETLIAVWKNQLFLLNYSEESLLQLLTIAATM